MKKILFVEEGRPTKSGGFGGSFYSMIETIKLLVSNSDNYRFIIVTYYEVPAIYNLIKIDEIEYRFVMPFAVFKKKLNRSVKRNNLKKIFPFFVKSDIAMYASLGRVKHYLKIIKEVKPDIVWGNNMTSGNFACFTSAFLSRVPYIQHQRAELKTVSLNFIITLLFSKKIITISKYVKNTLTKNKIINFLFHKKIIVVHNFNKEFLNYKKFEEQELKAIHFIFMGRLIPKKNIEEFLKLLNGLDEKSPLNNFSIQIYGDWESENYKTEILQVAKTLGLENKLILNSFSKKETIFKSNHLNFLFHTTKKDTPEPFGRVLLDAIYYGAIPITNGFGGAGEVIESNKNGIVYSINNLDTCFNLLSEYINNSKKYFKDLNSNYKFTQENFSGKKQFKTLNEVLLK